MACHRPTTLPSTGLLQKYGATSVSLSTAAAVCTVTPLSLALVTAAQEVCGSITISVLRLVIFEEIRNTYLQAVDFYHNFERMTISIHSLYELHPKCKKVKELMMLCDDLFL